MPPEMNRIPRLMLIAGRDRALMPLPDLAAAAVAGGVDAVQVRDPGCGRRGSG